MEGSKNWVFQMPTISPPEIHVDIRSTLYVIVQLITKLHQVKPHQ